MALAQESVDETALLNSPNAEWLTYGGNYAETHYSPLDQINESNIDRLGLAWEWEITGTAGNLEATPLVSDGIIYATGTWSNVFALDGATGRLVWCWDAGIVRGGINNGGPSVCCGPVNRGLAMYGNNVYVGLLDGRLVALDRDTGQPVWSVQTTPIGEDYSITGAPRVVKGNVIIGNSGADSVSVDTSPRTTPKRENNSGASTLCREIRPMASKTKPRSAQRKPGPVSGG